MSKVAGPGAPPVVDPPPPGAAPAEGAAAGTAPPTPPPEHPWRPPSWRRGLQLALATAWLLDGVLQLQPGMLAAGPHGFGGMLATNAVGNPGPVADSITWVARLVDQHAVAADTVFALVQIVIGLGIAWRPSLRPALALSVGWSVAVWWFGEGLGGVLHGAATPVGGGPGAVLFYALLAVLLWPAAPGTARAAPYAAAAAVGERAARAVWAATWALLALLSLVGSGRSPTGIRHLVAGPGGGPHWLDALDAHVAAAIGDHGLLLAASLAVFCCVVATAVYLPAPAARAVLAIAMAGTLVIWALGEHFGTLLAGGATDPGSGPLLVLLALAYWPHGPAPVAAALPAAVATSPLEAA